MAQMTINGMEEVIREMGRMGQLTGEVADEMLLEGGKVMKTAWQDKIKRFGHVDTGDMKKSVRGTKKPKVVMGVKTLEVYPRGKDHKGVRNAEKAFVLHYGKSTKAGSHFVEAVVEEGAPAAEKAMAARWDQFLQRGE